MPQVTFENVSKNFPGERGKSVSAVRDLSFSIERREFLVLTGPSGCGKTTTLRLIAGLERPSSGRVLLEGQPLENLPMDQRDIAMVFQNGALYPHMTVFENMAFGLKVRKLNRKEIQERIAETASWLELDQCLDRLPGQLSGGQAQRLAIGRALVRRPRLVLFDEPFSNVDAQLRSRLREELLKIHRQLAATFVYVTHDQMEALALGTRIMVMEMGRQAQSSIPQRIYDRPENIFVAKFFGSPGMNMFSGVLSREAGRVWFQAGEKAKSSFAFSLPIGCLQESQPLPAQVLLGIRPEDIHSQEGKALGASGVFAATVDQARAIGSETQLDLRIAGQALAARMPRGCQLKAGDSVNVSLDLARLHIFDFATGQRLNDVAGT